MTVASLSDITIKKERRQVAIVMPGQPEKLGFFHDWSYSPDNDVDFALVEMADGTMEYIRPKRIRFLPIGNEIPAEELEAIYRKNGLLKG